MSTDRELLELAAKAAGIDPDFDGPHSPRQWNPLDDDGEALRLAVELRLLVFIGDDFTSVGGGKHRVKDAYEEHGNDLYAATRRAIARAAAEIGRRL